MCSFHQHNSPTAAVAVFSFAQSIAFAFTNQDGSQSTAQLSFCFYSELSLKKKNKSTHQRGNIIQRQYDINTSCV